MELTNIVESNENVKKIYFLCDDGAEVESCLLFLEKHGTVICISSQVGCTQKCKFCAAGLTKFVRNLTALEVQKQVELIIEKFPERFIDGFEITYMGSGEPFNNGETLKQTIEYFFFHYNNLNKINISTLLPRLEEDYYRELKKYKEKLHLQFSLHFCTDDKRHQYFDFNLPSISDSLKYLDILSDQLNDKYTINYVLFDQINDSSEDAIRLANWVNGREAYVKISEMSPISKSKLKKSEKLEEFIHVLQELHVQYECFKSLGKDVNAGCGQFYNESLI
ncbi:MAG: radical SAM protein [Lachnospiraceae bacterium]|jgi:23S rRNA (adenine2503-C2)-methyltransferase|nr:radical SAM protein [Lachnospiraceae bacterium]